MDPERTRFVYGLRKKFRKGHSEDLLTSATQIGGYSAAAALGAFFLHVLIARFLSPSEYAIYGTYISILLTVLIAFSSIHLIITRFVSYHEARFQYEQITYLIRKSMKWLFALGFLFFALIVLLASPISNFFFIQDITPTVLLGFVVWFTILTPVFEGAFKGLGVHRPLGQMRVYEAVARIVFATTLVALGFGVSGAILGLGLGTMISLALTYKYILRAQTRKTVAPNMKYLRRYAFPIVISLASFAVLMNLDIIVAKHVFSAYDAGVFAAVSIVAKIPIFLCLVLVGMLYPKASRLYAQGKSSSLLLQNAAVILSVVMAFLTLVFLFFSPSILTLLFGSAYAIGPLMGLYVFAMSAGALALLLITYLLAVSYDKISFAMPLFVLALIVLLVLFHASFVHIILSVLLVMTALAAYAVYMSRDFLEFDYFL